MFQVVQTTDYTARIAFQGHHFRTLVDAITAAKTLAYGPSSDAFNVKVMVPGKLPIFVEPTTCIRCAAGIVHTHPTHDCFENATPVYTDGPLGHGYECAICRTLLQVG